MDKAEKRKVFHALLYPSLFLFIIWLIKVIEVLSETDFHTLGVYPRLISNLPLGVFFMPLIHSDWEHLFSNSVALFSLGFLLIFFYRPLHFKIFWVIYFASGIITWLIGRSSYHIGASGLIYGLMSFLFLSGLLRKHLPLMAVSAITILSYGSIVWGIFPFAAQFSWEGHLGGFISGALLAIYYRHEGPQKKPFVWTEDTGKEHNEWMVNPTDANSETPPTDNKTNTVSNTSTHSIKVVYTYLPNVKNEDTA
ncbi:MAG: rhomboid family intramembrane serine protease [Bacteroidia bacterium]|nr:rhomboid family intramembrane serine protease [Bacteroidia bacterium]